MLYRDKKIKTVLKEFNVLALFSFLIAVFAWIFGFVFDMWAKANPIGGVAFLLGLASLLWIKLKKQRGIWFAILSMIIGGLAWTLF